jgi:hypothetical protein
MGDMRSAPIIVASFLGAGALSLTLGGCGEAEAPEDTVSEQQLNPEAQAAPAGAPVVVASLAWDVPGEWAYRDSGSEFRAAEFVVPTDAGEAELVVFHFGPGQGGDAEANLARWARVMLDAEGNPVEPEIEVFESGELRTVFADYRGTYMSGPPMGEKTAVEDAALFGAVIEGGPEGTVFMRLTGPEAAVESVRDEWVSMLQSVRSGA